MAGLDAIGGLFILGVANGAGGVYRALPGLPVWRVHPRHAGQVAQKSIGPKYVEDRAAIGRAMLLDK
jgi:hypothetical protein